MFDQQNLFILHLKNLFYCSVILKREDDEYEYLKFINTITTGLYP